LIVLIIPIIATVIKFLRSGNYKQAELPGIKNIEKHIPNSIYATIVNHKSSPITLYRVKVQLKFICFYINRYTRWHLGRHTNKFEKPFESDANPELTVNDKERLLITFSTNKLKHTINGKLVVYTSSGKSKRKFIIQY